MKKIFKIASLFIIIIILLITYLSIVGIETDKFNKKIQNKIKEVDKNLSLDLKKVKLVLNPLKMNLRAKTLGPKIILKDEYLELENIKTNISLKSLISDEFSIQLLEISTKSIEISNLINFTRLIYQVPELIILEKLFGIKGYIIANIKVEFNKDGSLKENYIFSGFLKNTKANFSKNYDLTKLNLSFDITKDYINLENINVKLNNLNLESKEISAKKIKNGYLVKGNIRNNTIEVKEKDFFL